MDGGGSRRGRAVAFGRVRVLGAGVVDGAEALAGPSAGVYGAGHGGGSGVVWCGVVWYTAVESTSRSFQMFEGTAMRGGVCASAIRDSRLAALGALAASGHDDSGGESKGKLTVEAEAKAKAKGSDQTCHGIHHVAAHGPRGCDAQGRTAPRIAAHQASSRPRRFLQP